MSPVSTDLSGAKRRIIERLKRVDTITAPELAAEFGLTDTAIRQHLETLEAAELVERTSAPAVGRGRPPVRWRLTDTSSSLFADRHADLTVELIACIRAALGEEALEKVVQTRAERQLVNYRAALEGASDLPERIKRLADIRNAAGYEAEVLADGAHLTLVEHHCPIRCAAESCASLCHAELNLYEDVLGPDVLVERDQHLLGGDRRCTYTFKLA